MKDERFKELVKDGFYVKVNNKKEAMAVLEMCEKHNIKWSLGDKATKLKSRLYPYFLHISAYWTKKPSITCTMVFDFNPPTDHKVIDIKEFLPPKQEIHITRKGNETHAILKKNGKVIKHTVAKCHPDDEYSFEIGSSIAYNRLLLDDYVEPFKREYECMWKTQFKAGDIVRIRQWDNMAKEFGINYFNHINCKFSFLKSMEYLCGKYAKITEILNNKIYLDFFNENPDDEYSWDYSTDMIEPYQPRQAKVNEYVMVIKGFENSVFKKGTIVKCTGVTEHEYIVGDKFTEFKNSDGISILLSLNDYIVLEDYKPPLNCRFVVGNDVEGLTAGKIYEVKDGAFKDDDGIEFPYLDLGDEPLRTLDDLEEFIGKAGAGHYTDKVVEYIVLKD